ncbi:NADH-ubiquinone oxidoreductase-F iron-sulfur binding region domain-containing protein [Nocardioides cheoyonin]|uniref:NADH-ubiquinone oxidoreductase-F iron-sulfur binding region domain-containing protein n=1 Tax=Nocardioides cheoyonin TaxID=3156615 RepID=UPI0032B46410
MPDHGSSTRVLRWPDLVGGVLTVTPESPEDLEAYLTAGGYRLPDEQPTPALLRQHLEAIPAVTALRGRGGAGFPLWTKMETVLDEAAASGQTPVVVANGAEGEPLSVKDRYLMRYRPHLILNGAALAARALGAKTIHVYAHDQESLDALKTAADDLVAMGVPVPKVQIHAAQDTFVAGEATAAVRAINTKVARPLDHPPRMAKSGVGGAPTLVSNVETLARLARATMPDAAEEQSPLLVTLSGDGVSPTLIEVPYGLPVLTLLASPEVDAAGAGSVLAGGFFGGVVPISYDLGLSLESRAEHGGALGCASLYLIGEGTDPITVASAVADYFDGNNARQCRSCVLSTEDTALALRGIGATPDVLLSRLTRWSAQIVGRGACAVPDGVALLLRSLLRHYPEQLKAHLAAPPPTRLDWAGLTVEVPSARVLTTTGGVL